MKKIIITGCAGFIGFHLSKKFLDEGYNVVGLDNLNNYYSVNFKNKRLKELKKYKKFLFHKINIENFNKLKKVLEKINFKYFIHLAAQAGVRYSLRKPRDYVNSNIIGFFNILEVLKYKKIEHLITASSSSIYGNSKNLIFKETDRTDKPVQLYAATKKSNEVMGYAYSSLYNLPITSLRFFTVYGPYGRPDMAYYDFAEKIYKGLPIKVYNFGKQKRDFTHIEDIINSISKLLKKPPRKKHNFYRILNIGKGKADKLMNFINYLEKFIGKKAKIKFVKHQLGDVKYTKASVDELNNLINYKPKIHLKDGLKNFSEWFLKIKK